MVPQAPEELQSFGLVRVLTHVLEQQVRPLGQGTLVPQGVHVPLTHTCPAGHTCPQVPQFRVSVWVLVQVPLQAVWPDGQVTVQTPLTQPCPLGQTMPHMPQFMLSVWRLVQIAWQ
jgi:hypothetical protein